MVFWVSASIFTFTSTLFLYWYFGKRSTEYFEEMANCLYESNWPKLSIKLQKYLILMIANMQKPIYYHGLSIANLDLKTFNQVRINLI